MYHYSPPHGWSGYDYSTSPPIPPHYSYYTSQYANPHISPRGPAKRHSRKASYNATKDPGAWYSGYGNYHDAVPDYASPRKHEHVSANFGDSKKRTRTAAHGFHHPHGGAERRPSMSAEDYAFNGWDKTFRPSRSQKRPFFPDVVDDAFDESRYVYRDPLSSHPAAAQHRHASYPTPRKPKYAADQYFYSHQVPAAYDEADSPRRTRPRRASTSTRTPQRPRASPPKSPQHKATEEDAIKAGIPNGYSIKNWDPTEAPIILLGSVFDANSLGKWIYDWTVFHHGASTPMADMAGDLWLLLIKLSGKVKRADECLDRIHRTEAREMVEDFLESGERLWARFKKLLKACEQFMWKAAKRESGKSGLSMGRNAGCEFVDSIFGRDRELENTEKLMNAIRLWIMRFDANCEGILRRPTA